MHESRVPNGPGRKAFRGKVGQCNKRIRLGTSAAQPPRQAAAGVPRGAQQTVDCRGGTKLGQGQGQGGSSRCRGKQSRSTQTAERRQLSNKTGLARAGGRVQGASLKGRPARRSAATHAAQLRPRQGKVSMPEPGALSALAGLGGLLCSRQHITGQSGRRYRQRGSRHPHAGCRHRPQPAAVQ